MAARFQVKKTDGGNFQFFLLGANGRVIATSAPYRTKAACLNGVAVVRKAAPSAGVEDQASREWLAREAANTPVAKAARSAGRLVGKAKAKAEQVLAPPPPAKPARSRRAAAPAAKPAAAKRSPAKAAPARSAAPKAAATKTAKRAATPAKRVTTPAKRAATKRTR